MAMPLALCSCLTHIVTIAPEPVKHQEVVVVAKPAPVYTTTITTPKVQTITTTKVTALSQDVSLHLDLQAVGAAFAQCSSVQAFEYLLNNSSYMLSNLDLNRDGYIDYLRVLETTNGYAHVFLIQAVLAPNVFQDVATIVAEVSKQSYVQIIGAPYIYGPNYIVQPTYYTTPVIYAYLTSRNYQPWRSPWYWNHYPSCFHRPAPQFLNHYQAYVTTYMTNHRYCHVVTYPTTCRYQDYNRVAQPLQRNDYAQQHPEQDFTRRVGTSLTSPAGTTQTSSTSTTQTPSATTSSRSQNASDVRARQAESVTTQTINKSTSRSGNSTSASSSTSSTRSGSSTTSRSTFTTTPTRTTSATTTRSASTTTVTSRVANSGSARTTISPTPSRSGASTTSPTSPTSTATPSRSRSN